MWSRFFCVFFVGVLLHQQINAEAGATHIHFQELASTQVYAKEHASELGLKPGAWALITADSQTGGFGAKGQKWTSPPSENIYATYVTLFPKSPDYLIDCVIPATALATVKALSDYGISPGIKWANDVYVSRKKISGCLCEIIESERVEYYYLLIGIGINVNMPLEELVSIDIPATSLLVETGHRIDRADLLASLGNNLTEIIQNLTIHGFSPILDDINNLLLYRDTLVEIAIGNKGSTITGILLGLDCDGKLLLELADRNLVKTETGKIKRVFQ